MFKTEILDLKLDQLFQNSTKLKLGDSLKLTAVE